jgi:hypothetical protein
MRALVEEENIFCPNNKNQTTKYLSVHVDAVIVILSFNGSFLLKTP